MIVVILLLWVLNVRELVVGYADRIEERVSDYQQRELSLKRTVIEDLFQTLYEDVRTISMLPSVRSVKGANRQNNNEDVLDQGRLSLDTYQTIEQIYKNLSTKIRISEIYYILDGFRPEQGEVPFFMFDDHSGSEAGPQETGDGKVSDLPEEYEQDEYAYYLKQLQWYRERFFTGTFANDLSRIPALSSPLLRTCDIEQYRSISKGDVRDSYGLLYSVPVFDQVSQQFKGIISAVLRANVLEAALVGVPMIPVTDADFAQAAQGYWRMPQKPADLLLINSTYDIRIADRRNSHFSQFSITQLQQSKGRLDSLPVKVVFDPSWRMYHYLSPEQLEHLSRDLVRDMWLDIAARVGVLLALLAIFLRANRDQRRHHRELVQLAHYDSLTLLPNRNLLYKHLAQSVARAERHERKLGLMFVDIDDFGSINDSLGHKAGDSVLMAIAGRLRQSVRVSDEVAVRGESEGTLRVARMGGDDFAIIYEDLASAEDAVFLGERLLASFRTPIIVGDQKTEISLSGGMSVYPDDAQDIDALMACADYALRYAAEQGVSQFQMYNEEMRQKADRQTRLMQELPNAVRQQLFTLNYQPKQSLRDDRVISFEALIRWQHPELGAISPVEFIPLLEQSGLIVEVGRWVLVTACEQLKRWQLRGHPELHMSVNVSPRQLMLSDIVVTVDEVLVQTGIAPHTLILEITESMMIDNLEEGNRVLHRLKSRGVKLAIDDFGTGYSSMTYLQELPVDYLKLDKSMIDVIGDERGAHVIRTTIALALGLGLTSIAEGVEHQSQRELLKQMGCDLIQGYWFSRPLPAEQLESFLTGVAVNPEPCL